jgi:hypothetical protein
MIESVFNSCVEQILKENALDIPVDLERVKTIASAALKNHGFRVAVAIHALRQAAKNAKSKAIWKEFTLAADRLMPGLVQR